MYNVTFYENRALVMSKLTSSIPSENENIQLKGRKATVTNVEKLDERNVHVHIAFEKIVKKAAVLDTKKKRK
ncbi:hypothetical protein [Ureibacillus acetophenoni]|uniref:Uncharacterized protein n=1 Tax=Ureibacillus acetophenoni TaxID=614649 RepID=A0A285U686_9BACL|nr:hypothetical protein [Ureibacillus acetophenoni]SOC37460.1 hypothetical protein SAMN05877842_103225 [Ureibacillus acetophenoni]